MALLVTLVNVASAYETYGSISDAAVQPEWPWPLNESAVPVACVGDSITAGYLSTGGRTYPNQLQVCQPPPSAPPASAAPSSSTAITTTSTPPPPSAPSSTTTTTISSSSSTSSSSALAHAARPPSPQALLGSAYKVMNFGEGGRTMLKRGDNPYWVSPGYKAALASNATLLVLMLGTNDAKFRNWDTLAGDFPGDYADMIASFAAMPSKPKIWLMVPPPLYRDGTYGMNQTVINTLFPGQEGADAVRTLAKAARLPEPIDLFSLFQAHCPVAGGTPGHPENSTLVPCDWIARGGADACHPNDTGYGKIAEAVKAAIS